MVYLLFLTQGFNIKLLFFSFDFICFLLTFEHSNQYRKVMKKLFLLLLVFIFTSSFTPLSCFFIPKGDSYSLTVYHKISRLQSLRIFLRISLRQRLTGDGCRGGRLCPPERLPLIASRGREAGARE